MPNGKSLLIQKSKSGIFRQGFTLIETLVAIGVLGMFFVAIAFILQQVLTNIGESRLRATALTLAQTKMELVRNLPYNQVGTLGGIPQGPIEQTEAIVVNGLSFAVNTSIIYVDDPFDGVTPADMINTDYKRVRIQISWGGVYPSRIPVTLVTNIVPKGVETIVGGGTLFIQAFDSGGQPVSGATITIDNTQVSPAIHTSTITNSNGLVVLPGSPACVTCYQISVSKQNYSTDRTYSSSEVTNPLQPHATVIEGQITQLSFAIDAVSSVVITSRGPGPGYPLVTNVQFTLRGSKLIGYSSTDDPVYKYQYSTNTGGGTVSIPGLEWDTYTLDFASSAHNLAGSTPTIPFSLVPGATNFPVSLVVVAKTNTSLLVIVKNGADELQASASAQLSNTALPYDTTKVTSATGSADFGQAFFGGLTPATYDLKVTLSGYQESTASVSINGIKQETVIMNQPQ